MSTAVIIVGINDWNKYTKPLINSIQAHEPSARLVVVDNASFPEYPQGAVYDVVRLPELVSYAAAINAGIRAAGSADYYIVLNNDVCCDGKFLDLVRQQPDDMLAGNLLNHRYGWSWIDGWHYCIPRRIWREVGEFDEQFEVAAYEDADYCIRAENAGYEIAQSNHPFKHLFAHTRYDVDRFWQRRQKNLKYLLRKWPSLKSVFGDMAR